MGKPLPRESQPEAGRRVDTPEELIESVGDSLNQSLFVLLLAAYRIVAKALTERFSQKVLFGVDRPAQKLLSPLRTVTCDQRMRG